MERPPPCQREIDNAQFGNNTTIHQDNNTFNLHLPLKPARSTIHIIPYPRNEDLVSRPDLVEKLNKLLPQTSPTYCSAALWGLGGSGKTQVALDYAYQRCKKRNCSVFWVHADSEATFSQDYKTIAHAFGIDKQPKSADLFAAVRDQIAAQPEWVLILDNADDLGLFGVDQAPEQTKSLFQYIPRASTGTVLWTSRDAHIAGTLVGSPQSIEVARMKYDEAETLLKTTGGLRVETRKVEIVALLQELQWLPLAITQAGAYMRRTSTSIKEYSSLIAQSKRRWDILKANEFDRHRRPNMPNNVLETWSISIDRLRNESETAYNILNVIAYVANQNIPHEIITNALRHSDSSLVKPEKLEAEATKAITRLKEFSILGINQMEDGGRSYEMHKLFQDATRYGLSLWEPSVLRKAPSNKESEKYFSGIAVKVICDLFPDSEPETWKQCEKYCLLFDRASRFLMDRGRWREKELVDRRALEFNRKTWGEKHSETLNSIESLAITYGAQGRYKEAETLQVQVLELQQEILGNMHAGTIQCMSNLASTYWRQDRYEQAEALQVQVFELQGEILGDRHPKTIQSMASLSSTYRRLGRYKEAEALQVHALQLQKEILGDRHPDTIWSMSSLSSTYRRLGRYEEAEALMVQALDLRREILGDKHPDTIQSMVNLTSTYHEQGRYKEVEALSVQVLSLRRETLGDKHLETIRSMANLTLAYYGQGRYKEAETLELQALNLQREVLGDKHPDTIRSMGNLASTYHGQGLYEKAEPLGLQTLGLQRKIIGRDHPDTLRTMHNLACTWKDQGRHRDAYALMEECLQSKRSVLGPEHPETALSVNALKYWKSKGPALESKGVDSQSEQRERGSQKAQLNRTLPEDRTGISSHTPRQQQQGSGELPSGWEQRWNSEGKIYFANHITRTTTWADPREQESIPTSGQNNTNSRLRRFLSRLL